MKREDKSKACRELSRLLLGNAFPELASMSHVDLLVRTVSTSKVDDWNTFYEITIRGRINGALEDGT